jgi:hypothetical protein
VQGHSLKERYVAESAACAAVAVVAVVAATASDACAAAVRTSAVFAATAADAPAPVGAPAVVAACILKNVAHEFTQRCCCVGMAHSCHVPHHDPITVSKWETIYSIICCRNFLETHVSFFESAHDTKQPRG